MFKNVVEDKFSSVFGKLRTHIQLSPEDTLLLRNIHKKGTPLYFLQDGKTLDHMVLKAALKSNDFEPPKNFNYIKPNFNKIKVLLTSLSQKFRNSEDSMWETLKSGKPCSFTLSSWKTFNQQRKDFEFQTLYETVSGMAGETSDTAIYGVPVIILWYHYGSRKPVSVEKIIKSLPVAGKLAGKLSKASAKLLLSALRRFKPVIYIGEPFDISEFVENSVKTGIQPSNIVRELETEVMKSFETTWKSVLGPKLENLNKIKRELEHNPEIIAAYHNAVADGMSPEEALKELKHTVKELPADISPGILLFLMNSLQLVWYKIYKGFDLDPSDFDMLRKAAAKGPLLLIPCHKSHVDYLIISWVMQKYNLPVPHIAAGRNLSFWPLGPIFRGGGAFFIRRTFKGKPLYKTIVREYIAYLLKSEINLEFFIEGTRSRTGKVVYPKTGMLYFIAELLADGKIPSPQIVPVSIGYEKVIEENSYLKEMEGASKESENIAQVVKAGSVIFNKYGRVNLHFAKPFDFAEYIRDTVPDTPAFGKKVEDLAFLIIKSIVDYSTVTPTMLAASALLADGTESSDYQEVYEKYLFYRNFAVDNGIMISPPLKQESTLLNLFQESLRGFGSVVNIKGSRINVIRSKRPHLAYYRNGYLQTVAPYSISALHKIIKTLLPDENIPYKSLENMFTREFPHLNADYDKQQIQKTVENLSKKQIKQLASLLFDILEGQSFVFIYLIKHPDESSNQTPKKLGGLITQYVSKHLKPIRRESVNGFIFGETVKLLVDQGYLSLVSTRKTTVISMENMDSDYLKREYLLRRKILAALKSYKTTEK